MTSLSSAGALLARSAALISLAALLAQPVDASETITYSYDALGRLVQVAHSGAVNQNASAIYQYDKADNRSNVTVITAWTAPVGRARDFNGDHRSDILWRSDTGTVTDWLGTATGGWTDNSTNASSSTGLEWTIIAIGDFNGDGRSDILWRRNDGVLSEWQGTANGGFTVVTGISFGTLTSDWHVVGVGDFNGDGKDDILFRNADGRLTDWLGSSTGAFVDNSANALTTVPEQWHVAAVGDFNGDGRADILWRNDDGRLSDWLGTSTGGFTINDANALTMVTTDWHVVAAGDFNGDGRADILWRNDDGRLSDWLGTSAGGFTINDANSGNTVATSWRIAAIGDFNGDGRDDILWQSTTGEISNWLGTANGGFRINDANAYSSVPTIWRIEPSSNGGFR